MELSISRSKVAFLLVAGIVFFWFAKGRDAVSKLPPEVREVLPVPPAPATEPAKRAPAPAPEPAPEPEPEPEPAKPAKPAAKPPTTADGGAGTEAPPKPERTPDEKARSAIGVATAYAENGRYDKAYAALETAGKLDVSPEVRQELAAAEATVTRLMKERKTR